MSVWQSFCVYVRCWATYHYTSSWSSGLCALSQFHTVIFYCAQLYSGYTVSRLTLPSSLVDWWLTPLRGWASSAISPYLHLPSYHSGSLFRIGIVPLSIWLFLGWMIHWDSLRVLMDLTLTIIGYHELMPLQSFDVQVRSPTPWALGNIVTWAYLMIQSACPWLHSSK